MFTFALPLIVAVNLIAGFAFGVLHERIRWNQLITRGVIPAPQKKS